ncbi:hypothetical protein N0V90_002029 [Kalmusia sp. IMI 367209]|nr:hypothetical protein N0V90_002029 [Kalmusia sp. IMI 367209]
MTDIKDAKTQNSSPTTGHSEEKQDAPRTEEKARLNEDSNVSTAKDPTAQTTTPLASPPLDGGTDAWLSVLGGWFGFFVTFGWMNSIGVFQEYYQKNFLSNYSLPRSFLHVFGLMMASLGTEYYQLFLAQSVCSSIGASAIFYATMNAVSTWFIKKRATAIGIIASGSSLGGVILPIMLTRLIPKIGFGWSMRTLAFMFLGMMVITITTTKSRLTHTKKPFQIMEFVHPLREPPFVLLVMASFFFFFGNFLPFNFLILQAQEEGMSTSLSNYLLAIVNAASLFGRILPGYVADKLGRYNMMIATTLLTVITVLALWIPGHGNAAIIVFAALFGFFSGAFVSLGPAVVAQISEIKQIGVRNGTVYAFVSLAALTGNPIAGALITRDHGKFLYLQIFCGISMAVGCLAFLASRTAKVGLTWKRF